MNPFTEVRRQRLAAAVVMSAFVPFAGAAQQAVPPPPPQVIEEGVVPADPHAMLGELAGGPDGSPTALRLNPLPGTSTSIPTMNPAAVAPVAERQGQVVDRERTGIEGQCDPVVGLGNCPPPAAAAAAQTGSADAAGQDGPASGVDGEGKAP